MDNLAKLCNFLMDSGQLFNQLKVNKEIKGSYLKHLPIQVE
jgi:hypothetical protein